MCAYETLSKYLLAAIFAILGLGLTVLGVTLIPFIGILMAIPLFGLAGYFLSTRLNQECKLSF